MPSPVPRLPASLALVVSALCAVLGGVSGFLFPVPAPPPPFSSSVPGLSGLAAFVCGSLRGRLRLLRLPSLRCVLPVPSLRCFGVAGRLVFRGLAPLPLLPSLPCVLFFLAFPPPGCGLPWVAPVALTLRCVGLWLVPPPCFVSPRPPPGSPVLGCVGRLPCVRPLVSARSPPVGWGCWFACPLGLAPLVLPPVGGFAAGVPGLGVPLPWLLGWGGVSRSGCPVAFVPPPGRVSPGLLLAGAGGCVARCPPLWSSFLCSSWWRPVGRPIDSIKMGYHHDRFFQIRFCQIS